MNIMDFSNYLVDIVIIVTILLFAFIFAAKGLVQSLLRSFSLIISIGATYLLYPIISGLLRSTFIFESLRKGIYSAMKLDAVKAQGGAGQIKAIDLLALPRGLKNMLVDNNNSVIYELLGVHDFNNYIAGFIANIILNIVVSVLVFVIILIIIKIAAGAMDIASKKLPVVKNLNSLGGGLLGFAWGIIFIWVLMSVLTIFITTPAFASVVAVIEKSFIGKILYDNNVIMNVLLAKLFGWG